MGHLLFLILHVIAILFGMLLLFVTIPLHLIYSVVGRRASAADANAPRPETHVSCPDCKEMVLNEAAVCKHCGVKLMPQSQVRAAAKAAWAAKNATGGGIQTFLPLELRYRIKNRSQREVLMAVIGGVLVVAVIVHLFTP